MNGLANWVRRMVTVGVAALPAVVSAGAQAAPGVTAGVTAGLYGNLVLGVDGTTVTGVFADSVAGKGTKEEPQFSCSFVLRGTAEGAGAMAVTVWSPLSGVSGAQPGGGHTTEDATSGAQASGAQTSGTLTVAQGTAKLSLKGEPPGCAETGDSFVAKAYEEPAVKTASWVAARMVSGMGVRLQEAPVSGSGDRGRVTRGEVVVVDRRIGPWLQVETVFTPKPMRGWLRESDLYGTEP